MPTAMRSSNPALNEKTFEQYRVQPDPNAAGWAAPTQPGTLPSAPPTYQPPAAQAPAATAVMTNGGVTTATGVLLVLLVVGVFVGWNATTVDALGNVAMPAWTLLALFGALGLAIATVFKPLIARFTGPLYALLEGTVVGSISHLYNVQYEGIVMQAIGLTIGVFAVMLFLHATRLIRVTEKLRMCIIAATGAICLMYLFSFVASLFGAGVTYLHDGSTFGILLSLFIVGVASFNLLLDFDFVERGVAAGIDKRMEWFAAFGLLLTLVWIYLEVLRLLARLNRR